jgi:hypothetical protein
MQVTKNKLQNLKLSVNKFFMETFTRASSNALGAFSIIMLHLATIPSMLAVLLAYSDHMPNLELVVFIWAALAALFFKSLLEKNFFYIMLISLGFLAQTVIMSLILFK